MKRFLVVGLGNFGSTVAEQLRRMGHDVSAVDRDPAKVEAVARRLRRVVTGDATEPEVLERMGAGGCDAAVISTGEDVPASVLATIALRDLGVKDVYVKVVSDVHARILEKVGVTTTMFPEREAARLLAHHAASAAVLRYYELGPGFSAQEMAVPEEWIGRSLRELELPRHHGVSVVAVRDYLSDRIEAIPDPDAPLKDSDTLLVAGRSEDLAKIVPEE